MSIKINKAHNGYVVLLRNAMEPESYVFQELQEVLQLVVDTYQPGSRYDERRIYVIEAPGDKNAAFTEEHAKVIWGSEDIYD